MIEVDVHKAARTHDLVFKLLEENDLFEGNAAGIAILCLAVRLLTYHGCPESELHTYVSEVVRKTKASEFNS